MKIRWSLQDAKKRLSQSVKQATTSGSQTITTRQREKVVAPAAEDDKQLASPSLSLSDFFRQSPLYGIDLDLERSLDTGRDSAP